MQTQIDQILIEDVDPGSLSGVAAVICNSQGGGSRAALDKRVLKTQPSLFKPSWPPRLPPSH